MSTRDPTLMDVVLPSQSGLPERVWSLIEATRPVAELKKKVLALAPGFAWGPQAGRIAGMVVDLLDVGLARDVLVRVWNDGGLFRKYLDGKTYSPQETIEVTLIDHAVTSRHQPRIELTLNGVPLPPLVLDVSVRITVNGGVVEIRDGRIRRVRTGELKAEGELAWEGFLLASKKLETIQLNGVKDFEDDGIPVVG